MERDFDGVEPVKTYDTFTVSVQGGRVCASSTSGMGSAPPHDFKSPAGDPEFEEALRLLRLEPRGNTERERQEDFRRMLTEVSSCGGFDAVARRVGRALFDALLPPDGAARTLYNTCLESATRAGKGLRMVLGFGTTGGSEEQSVLALPWEYLYDPERGFYLGSSGDTLLTRRIVLPQAVPPFTTALPLKVLVVISAPHDQPAFSREDAWRCVEQGLREASVAGEIQYRLLPQPTLEALAGELSAWQPQVLHFIGHGNFDEQSGGLLAFEDDCGATDPVSADKLQKTFRGMGLRLVFLTSCRSAETDTADDFAGVTQALVKGGIPAVVAMQFSVPVASANIFDRALYSALARKEPIDEAVASSRRVLFASAACVTPRDWGIPALYLQAESSVVARRAKTAAGQEATAVRRPPTNLERLHLPRTNLLGRGNDMIRLAEALREKRKFVTLTGLGGIGKTALATESAYWHLERAWFPEGVFWVNARDATLEGVLNDMAAALGVADFDTLDTPNKIATLGRIHKERELLFIIDNADSLREAADFRRLLDGLPFESRGRLLLTSRRPMGIAGGKEDPLFPIAHETAMALFLYLWGADETTVEQLEHVAVICGRGMLEGHPLAITVAASLARKERNTDLTSLRRRLHESMIETLKDERTKEEEVSVEASLRLSWDALSDTEKALLSRVSVFRLPFREEAVAAVATELGDWQAAMRNLLGHLAERRGDRYYLHPVVQSFAGNRLESPKETHRRAGEFLVKTEYLDEHLEAIDHLEMAEEWRSVVEGVSAIINQLHMEGRWGVANLRLEQGLRAAREIGDKRNVGRIQGELGSNHLRRGNYRKAIEYYEKALAISREIGDRQGEGNRLGNLGNAYASLGEVKVAIDYYEKALAISREIGDRQGEGSDLGNLGNAYARLGEVKVAIDYCEKALAISREIGDRQGEGNRLGYLGNSYFRLGEDKMAIEYFEKAQAIAREIGDRQGEGSDLGNLGNAYFSL
ncbi:MAG: tetratricopeptide repeat protein, partial [Chloroflexi bacterium]|nr:tetratricopeptide repeat protein [Chloroflexota bacterium]